jgi:nicotinamidase/pyrazinamidase
MVNLAFWDVDTQGDFMLPSGKMYLKGAEKIRPALRKLYAFAKKAKIPVVASSDAYSPSDAKMKDWPEHCIRGTEGQRKLPETRLAKTVVLPNDRKSPIPELRAGVQVVLEKSHHDSFSNPSARDLVESSGIDRWAVFGVATDFGIRLAALGLLKLGRQVTVVSDAVHGVSPGAARQAVIEMRAAGADFQTAAEVIRAFTPSPKKRSRSR